MHEPCHELRRHSGARASAREPGTHNPRPVIMDSGLASASLRRPGMTASLFSVACIAHIAIETDIDLPCSALSLHEVRQHGIVTLNDGFDILAQHLHELGHLLAQSALVDGRDLAI